MGGQERAHEKSFTRSVSCVTGYGNDRRYRSKSYCGLILLFSPTRSVNDRCSEGSDT